MGKLTRGIYRKKPVEIEAVKFDGTLESILGFLDAKSHSRFYLDPTPHVAIHTPEGVMIAIPGDWIIKGIKGEYYPCKPDIFALTYELVAVLPEPVAGEP